MFSSSLRAGMMTEMRLSPAAFPVGLFSHLGRPRMNHNAGAQRMASPGKTSRRSLIELLGGRVALDDAVGTVLPGEDDHGHPAAGVGATSGEVEVAVFAGGLGGFEAVVLFVILCA